MASLTIPTGAVSITTTSKLSFSQAKSSAILVSSNNSEGFGGTGPQPMAYKLSNPGTLIGKSSGFAFPTRKFVIPLEDFSFKLDNTFGLRISNSRTAVFLPASAITPARLVVIKDFPSPLNEEVTNITGFSTLLRMYWRFDRTILNCSATMERLVLLTIME